ncbi:uncharacterized protein LOC119963742 [Scyliorhinus canicula]|uniref:uncharacterized protein LOC119963742 n=1 Tax=Scyliorhinus canicula TaxID=7830 RepID=UPI0018F3C929|nr:uncharacterized protein LOC119963742 [Scyliorhinus canicula]
MGHDNTSCTAQVCIPPKPRQYKILVIARGPLPFHHLGTVLVTTSLGVAGSWSTELMLRQLASCTTTLKLKPSVKDGFAEFCDSISVNLKQQSKIINSMVCSGSGDPADPVILKLLIIKIEGSFCSGESYICKKRTLDIYTRSYLETQMCGKHSVTGKMAQRIRLNSRAHQLAKAEVQRRTTQCWTEKAKELQQDNRGFISVTKAI